MMSHLPFISLSWSFLPVFAKTLPVVVWEYIVANFCVRKFSNEIIEPDINATDVTWTVPVQGLTRGKSPMPRANCNWWTPFVVCCLSTLHMYTLPSITSCRILKSISWFRNFIKGLLKVIHTNNARRFHYVVHKENAIMKGHQFGKEALLFHN